MEIAIYKPTELARAERSAGSLASKLLAGVNTRLAHTRTVARQAGRVAALLEPPWAEALVDAAWLHDIARNHDLVDTGLHCLDGARWLRVNGWAAETCQLVAWHSVPLAEARLRGLRDKLIAEFERPPRIPLVALTWADMTSSPDGSVWSVDQRLAEILDRYPPGSITYRATVESAAELCQAAEETEHPLRESMR